MSRSESNSVSDNVHGAYLVLVGEGGCNSHELAGDLACTAITAEDQQALSAAVRRGGPKALKPLKNPWFSNPLAGSAPFGAASLAQNRRRSAMIASYYFWKWADNDLPGRPVEVFADLIIDPDFITYADTLRIFQAFLRGEPRPAQYHWRRTSARAR